MLDLTRLNAYWVLGLVSFVVSLGISWYSVIPQIELSRREAGEPMTVLDTSMAYLFAIVISIFVGIAAALFIKFALKA